MQHKGLRLDVQGLRGVAVALVVIEHAKLALPGGFVGVDVFFVISGFVITSMVVRDLASDAGFSLRRFSIRRANRLLPAAGVVLAVTAIGTALLLSPFGTQQQSAGTGVAAALGMSNIALYFISADYFSEHVQSNPFLHTWSLGVEEQFYVLFPLLLCVAWRVGRSRRSTLFWCITVVAVVSFSVSLVFSFSAVLPGIANPSQFAFYMTPTRAWEFAVGAALALWSARARWHAVHPVAVALGLILIAASAVWIEPGGAYPGTAALLPVTGTALVLAGGARHNPVSGLLAQRPLAWLGDVSYSLYLWHWPLLVFAWRLWPGQQGAVLGAIALAFALAALTHRFVETPFRGRAVTSTRRSLRAPVIAVVAGSTASVLVLGGALTSWGDPKLASAADQLLARPISYNECLSTTPVSQRDLGPCTWGPADGRPVYLLGDSNAQQFTEAARSAAVGEDRRLVVATWGGCPFLDIGLQRASDASKGAECARYVEDTTSWLRSQPRGTVLIAASSEMVLAADDTFRAGDGSVARTTAAKSAVWAERLAQRIGDLQRSGFDVVLIRTLPHFPGAQRDWWHPVECQNAVAFTDPAACGITISERSVRDRQHAIRTAETEAIRTTGAGQIDLLADICRDGVCSTFRNGTWLYRDGLHISPEYSGMLAPLFRPALAIE